MAIFLLAGVYSDSQKEKHSEQVALLKYQDYDRAAMELLGQASIEICLAAELPTTVNIEMLMEDIEITLDLLNTITGNVHYTTDHESCDVEMNLVDFSTRLGTVRVAGSNILGQALINPDGIDAVEMKVEFYQQATSPETRYCSTTTLVHELLHILIWDLNGYPYQDSQNPTHSSREEDILYPYSDKKGCRPPTFNNDEYDYFRSQYLQARVHKALAAPRAR